MASEGQGLRQQRYSSDGCEQFSDLDPESATPTATAAGTTAAKFPADFDGTTVHAESACEWKSAIVQWQSWKWYIFSLDFVFIGGRKREGNPNAR